MWRKLSGEGKRVLFMFEIVNVELYPASLSLFYVKVNNHLVRRCFGHLFKAFTQRKFKSDPALEEKCFEYQTVKN